MVKRVLIFGGGFNPPTRTHEAIIAACLALPQFDEVWVMPSGDRLDKQMAVSDEDRLRMLNIVKQVIFASNPRLRISDFELLLPRPTKTHQTVKALAAAYPGNVFSFAYGADAYHSMPTWEYGNELREGLSLVIFSRDQSAEVVADNVVNMQVDGALAGMSSTAVRRALAMRVAMPAELSRPVADYIARRKLYQRSG